VKLIYIDVETTGIAFPQSGLIQLAGAIEIEGQKPQTFQYHIQTFPDDVIEEEALAINGITREEMAGFDNPRKVYRDFINLLEKYVDRYDRADKFHFIGYNAIFDSNHLRAWFEKNNDKYFGSWFYFPPIDVMGMAALHLMTRRAGMKDFKLLTVARELGLKVDEEKMHDARYDVGLTREMFKVLWRGEMTGVFIWGASEGYSALFSLSLRCR